MQARETAVSLARLAQSTNNLDPTTLLMLKSSSAMMKFITNQLAAMQGALLIKPGIKLKK